MTTRYVEIYLTRVAGLALECDRPRYIRALVRVADVSLHLRPHAAHGLAVQRRSVRPWQDPERAPGGGGGGEVGHHLDAREGELGGDAVALALPAVLAQQQLRLD